MAKKDETKTKLQVWLSTGNRIDVYYNGDVSESIGEDIEDCMRVGIAFYVYNWDVDEAYIYDRSDKVLFADSHFPDMIDGRKILGWSTS